MAVEGAAFQAALEKYGGHTAVTLFRAACIVLILAAFGIVTAEWPAVMATAYVILNLLGFPAWLRAQLNGPGTTPACPSCKQAMRAREYDCPCGAKSTMP